MLLKSHRSRYLFLFFLTMLSESAMAQRNRNALESGGVYWTRYYLQWNFAEGLRLDAEVDNRRFFGTPRQFQTIVRSTLFFLHHDNFNIGTGLAYSQTYSLYTPLIQPEIRPHQEMNLTHAGSKWNFNHRIRTEQRFSADTTRTFVSTTGEVEESRNQSYSFDLRVRYKFTADFAVLDKHQNEGHLTVQASTELMAHLNVTEFFNTFRTYAGFVYFVANNLSIEPGYLRSIEKEHRYDYYLDYNNVRGTIRHRF